MHARRAQAFARVGRLEDVVRAVVAALAHRVARRRVVVDHQDACPRELVQRIEQRGAAHRLIEVAVGAERVALARVVDAGGDDDRQRRGGGVALQLAQPFPASLS